MPGLQLTTNVKVEDPKAFVLEFSKLAAQTLGKPESYISVSYSYEEALSFAGTFEPAFLMTVTSLGNINAQANVGYSKSFFEFFKEKLGIQDNRGYITFNDPGRENMGFKSSTFGA
ncbi:hypothetical protein M0805_005504 [Coniferiporia weirii]|nr:hypothetical protein M0805_005504 [Coniferiporia weirii]